MYWDNLGLGIDEWNITTITKLASRICDEGTRRDLKKLEIPMSPNNFELWYVYYARQNQEVIEGIDGTIKEGRPITTQICDDLHKKYLLDTKRMKKVREAGDKMNDALAYVTDMVREAKASTEQYGRKLNGRK